MQQRSRIKTSKIPPAAAPVTVPALLACNRDKVAERSGFITRKPAAGNQHG